MSNEDYLQFEPMLIKIASKYKDNKYSLEFEDLMQVGAIGIMYGFNNYNSNSDMKLSTYIYKCIEWHILKEFKKYERIEAFTTVSIHKQTGEDTTIEDILQDIKTDIEANIIDRIVLEEYINEFNKYLDSTELDVLYLKVFDNLTYKAIEYNLRLNGNEANKIFTRTRRKLLNKSHYIRERYLSYINSYTNIYNNPLRVVLSRDI